MKKLKKFMAALLVAFMALAVIPAGAFAAESEAKGTFTPSVYKVVPQNGNVSLPQTFQFTISLDDSKKVGSYDPSTVNSQTKTVTVENAGSKTLVEFDGISLGAGIYRFKIEETANPVFTTTPANVMYAYVIVDNAGTVSNVFYSTEIVTLSNDGNVTVPTTPAEGGTKLTEATFTNTVNTGYNFTVTKKVDGTAANSDDEFSFDVTATLPEGTSADVLLNGTKVGTLTYNNGEASTVTVTGVKANSKISTTALPNQTVVTVTEANNNYDSQSWKLNDVANGNTSKTQTFTINSSTQNYEITNKKDAATITGFVMHYTPYIALVVVAGVAVALIAKRRNHSEF